jgi:hypothetical protein
MAKSDFTQIKDISTLKCPRCGHAEKIIMPVDYCQFFYECLACHEVIKAKEGDCCVFCSYGDVPCPSVQKISLG